MSRILIIAFVFFSLQGIAQRPGYWQQAVDYNMDIVMDTENHQYKGKQTLIYTNNSPDDLDRVFYHLFFNAFQPNSMMDVRSRWIKDPDGRVRDRIQGLQEDEIGYIKVKSLTMNGKKVKFETVGTILEVDLPEPIKSGEKATLVMEWDAQIPQQVRRSGRNNREGIDYSMTQWYPKMVEYDHQGWHAYPYIAREFHGVWGDFDVKITLPKKYTVGGSGYLQNPEEIGKGYETEGMKVKQPEGETLTWHFKAPKVHDFAWGADPDYVHTKIKGRDDLELHFFYVPDEKTSPVWEPLPETAIKIFEIIEKHYGVYPYKQYSIIQGGDGGMEYPMCTLINGKGGKSAVESVTIHEVIHSWYQMVLATNEALYAWMDEGFTTYATNVVKMELYQTNANLHTRTYGNYFYYASAGAEEPMSTHADHYDTNGAYSIGSYVKGAVFVHQLEYIVGKETFDKGMLRYYDEWAFKHPEPNDFIRVMEKESGLELDWYKEYFVNSTKTIDYGIKSVKENGNQIVVDLERIGYMPMPVDVEVEYN
ncbi:MAG: M1 family metallopeptidase, partial [Bacteroidota bacterium]